MSASSALILGEFRRSLDERFRLSIPAELSDLLVEGSAPCILAKELPGSLSLWNAERWRAHLESGLQLVEQKIEAGRLAERVDEVQRLGRLLSTRHRDVQLGAKNRLLIPEGFREFLGVEPGGDVLIVGAALCVEIWRPDAWLAYLQENIPQFRKLFDNLSG